MEDVELWALLPLEPPCMEVLVSDCLVDFSSLLHTLHTVSLTFPSAAPSCPLHSFKGHLYKEDVSFSDLLNRGGQVPKTSVHTYFAKLTLSACLKYSLLPLLYKAF